LGEGIFKFHNLHLPKEARVFQIPETNIRVWNDKVLVYEVKIDDMNGGNLTFRHYSFYDKWFEISITLDANGNLISEPGPIDWSFNCDICTPYFSKGSDFENIISHGLITENERIGARKGLESLTELIKSGNLATYLEDICSFSDLISLSDPIPYNKLQLSKVSLLTMFERERYYGTRA
jgi:hypothetical protein